MCWSLWNKKHQVRLYSLVQVDSINITCHTRFHRRHHKQGGCWPGWFPAAEALLSCLYCSGRCHKIVRISGYEGKKQEINSSHKIRGHLWLSNFLIVSEGWRMSSWIKKKLFKARLLFHLSHLDQNKIVKSLKPFFFSLAQMEEN